MTTFAYDPEANYWIERVYTGPWLGWILTYTDKHTGQVWGYWQNQWLAWDGYRWVFTGQRTGYKTYNIVMGLIIGFAAIMFGAAVGGPALPIMAVFGLFMIAVGFFYAHLQNQHPRAYEAVSVAWTGYLGAKAVRSFFRH